MMKDRLILVASCHFLNTVVFEFGYPDEQSYVLVQAYDTKKSFYQG